MTGRRIHPRSEPAYDVHLERDISVPMRDGVRLAADIYFPAAEGRPAPGGFPTLLERTPYDKGAAPRPNTGRYFASRGYVTLFQDTRGRFKSEGSFVKYLDDPADGYRVGGIPIVKPLLLRLGAHLTVSLD